MSGKETPDGSARRSGSAGIALYHVVRPGEDFETAARMLLELVRKAAEAQPGVRRGLFLDIEGHRNSAGGYDHDMMELQTGFILGYLAPWLSEIHLPLLKGKKAVCPGQREDVPHEVSFLPGGESKDRETTLHAEASRSGQPIYDADSGDYLLPDGSRRTRFDPDEPERKS